MATLFAELERISRICTPRQLRADSDRKEIVSVALLKIVDANVKNMPTTDDQARRYLTAAYKNACTDELRRRGRMVPINDDAPPDDELVAASQGGGAASLEPAAEGSDGGVASEGIEGSFVARRKELDDVAAWFFANAASTIFKGKSSLELGVTTVRTLHRIALGETTLDDVIRPEIGALADGQPPTQEMVRKVKERWYTRAKRTLKRVNEWLLDLSPRDVPCSMETLRLWIRELPLKNS
jgi:DNA-directed RNA polymerase specialized sigma24 family protein